MEQIPTVTQHTVLLEFWSPPDPSFNHRAYIDLEIEANVFIFENLAQLESEGELDICRFIDDEALESDISQSIFDVLFHSFSAIHAVQNMSRKNEKLLRKDHRQAPRKNLREAMSRYPITKPLENED